MFDGYSVMLAATCAHAVDVFAAQWCIGQACRCFRKMVKFHFLQVNPTTVVLEAEDAHGVTVAFTVVSLNQHVAARDFIDEWCREFAFRSNQILCPLDALGVEILTDLGAHLAEIGSPTTLYVWPKDVNLQEDMRLFVSFSIVHLLLSMKCRGCSPKQQVCVVTSFLLSHRELSILHASCFI